MSLDTLKALGVTIPYKAKYDNFIGGKWVAPVKGEYFDVISPITGKPYTKAARSSAEDVELALDAAHAAADKWGTTGTTDRANILLKIADRIEANLALIAVSKPPNQAGLVLPVIGSGTLITYDHDLPLKTIPFFTWFLVCLAIVLPFLSLSCFSYWGVLSLFGLR